MIKHGSTPALASILVLAPAALFLAVPTQAQTAPAPPAQQDQAQAPSPQAAARDDRADRMRCRNVFQVGSRIPERICRTQAEWDRIEEESREALERNRRGASASGDGR